MEQKKSLPVEEGLWFNVKMSYNLRNFFLTGQECPDRTDILIYTFRIPDNFQSFSCSPAILRLKIRRKEHGGEEGTFLHSC